jgi:O-acetyl-ADP-ribose deacetylase (regulator of RNase III)
MTICIREMDLVEAALVGKFDVVLHGCNCFCTMESGVAKQLAQYFPSARQADNKTVYGDRGKLGTYSYSVINIPTKTTPIVLVNGYTQFHYGRKHFEEGGFNYDVLTTLLNAVNYRFGGRGLAFGIPFIGADRSGGNPDKIFSILQHFIGSENVTLAILRDPKRKTPAAMQRYFQLATPE